MRSLGENAQAYATQLALGGSFVDKLEVVDSATAAAIDAARAGAFDNAARHLARAIADVSSDDSRYARVHYLASIVASRAADIEGSKAYALKASIAAMGFGDLETAVYAAMVHAAYGRDGEADADSIELLTRVRAIVATNDRLRATADASFAEHQSQWRGKGADSRPLLEDAVRVATETRDQDVIATVGHSASLVLLGTSDLDRRDRLADLLEQSAWVSPVA